VARPKKAVAEKAPSDHEAKVEAYKSAMLNTTLYEPFCPCGWSSPRCFTESQAQQVAKAHVADPGAW